MVHNGFEEDPDFMGEAEYQRATFDKASGEVVNAAGEGAKPAEGAEDLFAVEDAGQGEQFMAVKPWIGAVVEPDNRK